MNFIKNHIPTVLIFRTLFILIVLLPSLTFSQTNNISSYQYVSPVPGSSMILPETNIIIRYGEFIDQGSLLSDDVITVVGSKSGTHRGSLFLSDDGKTIIFKPHKKFMWNETVSVSYSGGISTVSGDELLPFEFQFKISEQNPRALYTRSAKEILELNDESLPDFINDNSGMQDVKTVNGFPEDFPTITIMTSDNPTPGFLFFAPFSWPLPIGYLIIADNSGNVVYYERSNSIKADFKVQPNGLLTYYDLATRSFYAMDSSYNVIDTFQTGNGYETDIHELQILPNEHSLLMAYDPQPVRMDTVVEGGDSNAIVIGLIIQELDADKNVVFQWRSWDHFLITDATEDIILTDSLIDYVHGNAIEQDFDGNLLISSRHLDEVTKIDRQTGDIIWRFGGLKSRNNQFTFINDNITFSHQHDIRRLANGNVTLFDNGNLHQSQFSRAIEYQLDEQNKTATLVWDFNNNLNSYSFAMGNVQRLPNENSIIGWGFKSPGTAAISEVRMDKSIAFELGLPDTSESYRAFRFPWRTNLFVTNPDSVFFEAVPPGSTETLTVNLVNNSTDSVVINDLYNKDTSFTANVTLPFVLPPSGSVPLDIMFSPPEDGFYIDTIHIRSDTDTSRIAQILVVTGRTDTTISSVDDDINVNSFKLEQNYPNPFNPVTKIVYQIPQKEFVTLKVYDLLGREVATLVNEEKPAGSYTVLFNGENLASGVYIYKIRAGSFSAVKKLLLLK